MPVGTIEDEVVYGPIYVAPRTPKTIASAEVLWGPLPLAPAIPPAGLMPLPPEAGDPAPTPTPDTTPLPNDLTVTVNGTPWVTSTDRTVQVPINDTGTGTAAGPTSDPVAAAIVDDDELLFTLKGTAILLAKATKLTRVQVTPEEEAGQFVTVHADGVLAEWDQVIVLPDYGSNVPSRLAPPRQDSRIFNYSAHDGVDATSWGAAVATDPLYGEPNQRFVRPESWPDPGAEWIWDRDSSTSVPVGTARFRRIWNLPVGFSGTMPVQIWTAGDGFGEVSLDGIKISDNPGHYSGKSFHADVVVGADHFHLLTAKLENAVGRSGFIYSILPVDGDHLGPPIAHSDSSTKCLAYTDGSIFNAGKIIRTLFDEANNRGCLLDWTLAFDDDVDSNGNPWPKILDYSIRVGLSYLDALKQMAEQWIDYRCSPSSRTLYAYRVGELGGLTAAPLLTAPRGLTVESG